MPRIVRTARGDQVDFDTIIIKQQLAQAPMNVEVARRKDFIDSKEGKVKETSGITTDIPINPEVFVSSEPVKVVEVDVSTKVKAHVDEFEDDNLIIDKTKEPLDIVPDLPVRKK